MQKREHGGQLALSLAVQEHLDGLLLEAVVRVLEELASMTLPARELYHGASPRVRAFALTASMREAIRQYWSDLLRNLARNSVEANEVAMWAYLDEVLEPVRRGRTPLVALEWLWFTLEEHPKAERALELGYQVEPVQGPEELRRHLRRIVEWEAWQDENSFGKRRNGQSKLGEGTVGGQEVAADQEDVPIRAWMEVTARSDRERAYIAFLGTGFGPSEAAQRAGLTPGEARALRERAGRNSEFLMRDR